MYESRNGDKTRIIIYIKVLSSHQNTSLRKENAIKMLKRPGKIY